MDRPFEDSTYGDAKCLKNWPMIYVLENGRQAYIGESTNVSRRMKEHKENLEKQIFDTVHFIYWKEFNQSVTFDYESRLIQLFSADEHYIMMNKNDGLADKDYFDKQYYSEKFQLLWERLRKKKLVLHTIPELMNSDLFKYSPYKALNESQRRAVEAIFERVRGNLDQPVIVRGMPGSGKTIVAVFLFKYLKDYCDENGSQIFADKKIGLVIPQTSLRKTLKNLFRHIYGLKAADVIGPSDVVRQKYDILLVDEAHRLHQRKNITNYRAHDENNQRLGMMPDATELDWILRQSRCPILFFDAKQVVGPSGIPGELMEQAVNNSRGRRMAAYYTLSTQMRVKGGNSYIDYVTQLLDGKVKKKKLFDRYEFKVINSFARFEELLLEKEKVNGLVRMVAGYAWPWISKKDKTKKDIVIEGHARMWNNRTKNWVHCPTAIDEVGCIHSVQGYDLNYAFVILGWDIGYDPRERRVTVDRKNYFDQKGKTPDEEKLSEYIKNIYYVLMTRGIEGTYLYVCDPELRKYLSQYIDVLESV